jgi:hypothetical protein
MRVVYLYGALCQRSKSKQAVRQCPCAPKAGIKFCQASCIIGWTRFQNGRQFWSVHLCNNKTEKYYFIKATNCQMNKHNNLERTLWQKLSCWCCPPECRFHKNRTCWQLWGFPPTTDFYRLLILFCTRTIQNGKGGPSADATSCIARLSRKSQGTIARQSNTRKQCSLLLGNWKIRKGCKSCHVMALFFRPGLSTLN